MNSNEAKKKELFEKFFSHNKKEGVEAMEDLMNLYHQEIQTERQKRTQLKKINKTGFFYPIK